MIITNKFNLPSPILEAIRRDPYTKGDARFSATELLDSPRVRILLQRHDPDIERDAADFVFSLLGRAVHLLLETYGRKNGLGDYVERRCFAEVAGCKISGGMDLQNHEGDRITILDWKLTTAKSAWGGKPEWERQLNTYAWLYEQTFGRQPDDLEVCAIVRDWKKEAAQARADYPQAPIVRIPVTLWTSDRQEAYIQERVAIHAAARAKDVFGDEPPLCTDEERWKRGGTWALLKVGNKRATSVHASEEEAKAALEAAKENAKKGAEFTIDHRPAIPIRCVNYCDAAPFCSQWQAEKQALNLNEIQLEEVE